MERTNKISISRTPISRRRLVQTGVGLAAGLAAVKSFAQACGLETGKQILGPFFPNPNTPEFLIHEDDDMNLPLHLANDNDLTQVKGINGTAAGRVVHVAGQVTDSTCTPIAGATVIIWQASETGRYNHVGDSQNQDFPDPRTGKMIKRLHDPNFQYWGKCITDANGRYSFKTIIPGFYPADLANGWYRPPHIHFMVLADEHERFVTQMYFRGASIVDNDFYQELNAKDFALHDPKISEDQSKQLVVDFFPIAFGTNPPLSGMFNIQIP